VIKNQRIKKTNKYKGMREKRKEKRIRHKESTKDQSKKERE
jgi:hypothetical protein